METAQLYERYKAHPIVTIDSRKVAVGSLFFALQGSNSDGNAFAANALDAGAAFAIIDNPDFLQGNDERFILVEDSLKALQQLANFHRRQFEIPLIAITGSNGKTTSKELMSAVLASRYMIHFTKGNFNNHIGLPLTLLEMQEHTEVAVIEMGANHIGEINMLCQIAQPTHGIITNIGKAHLEGFGNLEGVKQGKAELYQYLAVNGGTAFVNLDEEYLLELSKAVAHCVYYKCSEEADPASRVLETKLIAHTPFLKAGFQSEQKLPVEVNSQLIGKYNFNNLMTAISIGRYFKVTGKLIKQTIENYLPRQNRSQLLEIGSNTYIMDAYNANPTSMLHALAHFGEVDYNRKIVIIGDMLELGKYSINEHIAVMEFVEKQKFDKIILVGSIFQQLYGSKEGVECFPDVASLKNWFDNQSFENTTFLLKGSRGIRLEKLLEDQSINQ